MRRFPAPACEHFVRMMVVMLMVMAAAGAVLSMLMVVAMAFLSMLMVVAVAAFLTVFMVVAMAFLSMLMVVAVAFLSMLMVVAMAFLSMLMVMVAHVFLHQFFFQGLLLLYYFINLLPVYFIPWGRDDSGLWVLFPDCPRHRFGLLRLHILGPA